MATLQYSANIVKGSYRASDDIYLRAVQTYIDPGYSIGNIDVSNVKLAQITNVNTNGNSQTGQYTVDFFAYTSATGGTAILLCTIEGYRTGAGWYTLNTYKSNLTSQGKEILKNNQVSSIFGKCTNGWFLFDDSATFTIQFGISSGGGGSGASTVSVPEEVDAGKSIKSTLTIKNTSYRHTIQYLFYDENSAEYSLSPGTKEHTFTIPLNWINKIPNATSGGATVRLRTYSGNTLIGYYLSYFDINVPSNITPTGLNLSAQLVDGFNDMYIKGKSRATISASASGAYGSTIRTLSVNSSPGGISSTSFPYTTNILNTAGEITITLTATDSRGRRATGQIEITVTDYSAPSISSSKAFRSNASGTADDSGKYITVNYTFTTTPLDGNTVTATVRYKKTSETSWSATTNITSGTNRTVGGGNIDLASSYNVEVTIKDSISSATATSIIPTESILFDFRVDRAGIGRWTDGDNRLQIPTNWTFDSGPINASGDISGNRFNGYTLNLTGLNPNPWYDFLTVRDSEGNVLTYMVADAQSKENSPGVSVRIRSRGTDGKMTGYTESYVFPTPNIGIASSAFYGVLTTKHLVKVSEGGTGANNATAARKNLKVYNGVTSRYSVGGNGGERVFSISFGTTFASDPTVVVSADDGDPGIPLVCSLSNVSRTGCTAVVRNEFFGNSINARVHWVAMGT